tara:strand:+ start:117 stop:566 length:450 start_codon:yes stop_codon:yes gene_type:complete
MFSIGFSKSNKGPSLTNFKWISEGSPKSEVWFQDWSGYVRLFVTTFVDTSSVDPGPYITETKNKPYLTPQPYKLVQKNQLIGNIEWDKGFSWDGKKNNFTWKVDRANPKIKLPHMYKGVASYEEGRLILEIEKDSQIIYSMVLKPVSYY